MALAEARNQNHAFGRVIITADAHAACVGAHKGGDGGVIVAGTGSIGWAIVQGRHHRVGGWGIAVSDEGSGAWIGRETLRWVLTAYDGRCAWTDLLRAIYQRFDSDPHTIVAWAASALPRDFGMLAPEVISYASREDGAAIEIARQAAAHLEALAKRLIAIGVTRLSLIGGLGSHFENRLSAETRGLLTKPIGGPLEGAFLLARDAAQSAAA